VRVRILGGGVAGLAVAQALRLRWDLDDVVVLEGDTAAEAQARPGHGMIVMPNGVEALRALGAGGCLDRHRALTRAVFQDERGRVLHIDPMEGMYCVTRRGLVETLRAGLPDDAVQFGRRCTNVALDVPPGPCAGTIDRRVQRVGFDGGSSLSDTDADLFIGADGTRSALWSALNPAVRRARSRVFEIVISTPLPELAEYLGTRFVKTVFADRGLAFGLLSPCADHVIGFLQFDVHRHGVPVAGSDLLEFVAATLADPPEPVAGFLRDADASTAHLWRPVDGDVATRLCAGNAVVIGDAAHPLLPFCSQGVSAALEDAVGLADAIAAAGVGADLLAEALERFCEVRRGEVRAFVDGGRRILAHFVGTSPEFVAPYVDPRRGRSIDQVDVAVDEDPLFADDAVDLATLRRRAYNHRWAVQLPNVIPLTAADLDFPVCEDIITAVQRYLGAGYTPYGPPEGLPELRRAATEALRHRHGLRCDPDTLLPTDGAASAMFLAARLAIRVPGDEAIIPDPVDFLLERSVAAAGGVVRRWRTAGGRYDAAQLEALVTPRTRLISLCNPHNPLGRVLRRAELEAIADVALRHDLWLLSDEVWSDIVYAGHAHVCLATLGADVAARTLTVFGFSKSYGLAGMRLGMLVAPDAARREQIMALAHAHDTAYGASTISQVAGAAAYELADGWLKRFVAHLQRRRDQAVDRLTGIPGVRCAVPEGTFVAFPDISGLGIDQDELASRLLEHHDVAVIPGSPAFFGPGAAGHVRLGFATSREILAEGLDRMEAGLRMAGTAPQVARAA
jgi:aspartate/methionine/tyrosine aminotransferase/2-polyprenyl-6-methoxyphenol hydroxylase-like FAD-dependent oxidoreductase